MKKSTTAFVSVWCVLSVLCALVMLYYTILENTKLSLMILLNSLLFVGLGIFFAVFRDKIYMLLDNYKRKKEI